MKFLRVTILSQAVESFTNMICLRCGYCCIRLDVAIVNPGSIRQDGTVDNADPSSFIFKPSGHRCPYLVNRGEIAECAIHSLPCYKGTPCQQFEQIGLEDDMCVLRDYLKTYDGQKI